MIDLLVFGGSNLFKNKIYPALLQCEEVRSISIASRSNTDTLRDFKAKVSSIYDDYDHALKINKPDWVYISTKNDEHFDIAQKALSKKCNVIIDKPAVLHTEEALELVNLSKKNNVYVCEATVFTFHKQFSLIKNYCQKHKFQHINAQFSFPRFNNENFRLRKNFGGGAIYDLGAYIFGLGRHVWDSEPEEVRAHIVKESRQLDNFVSVNLLYQNDCTLIGAFGFGTAYINKATYLSKDLKLDLDRVFTTTPDLSNEIRIVENQSNKIIKVDRDDPFLNFLNVCFSFKFPKKFFHDRLLGNARGIDLLKSLS